MKKFACIILSFLAVLSSFTVSFAVLDDSKLWQEEYFNIINITKVSEDTRFVLVDTDYDKVPELFCGDNDFVTAFSFKNNALVKLYETYSVPIEYIENIKAFYNPASSMTEFAGQCKDGKKIVSYKLSFGEGGIGGEVIENEKAYFESCSLSPLVISVMDAREIRKYDSISAAAKNFTSRHTILAVLSDDTASFNYSEREEIKEAVSEGDFLCFEKISYLSSSDIFVQFYKTSRVSDFTIPQSKAFAVISKGEEESVTLYENESEIDTVFLSQVNFADFVDSNVYIDYGKVSGILNFDEHLNYLNNLVSEFGQVANENAKKEISNYIEYAVNKSSRTQLKSKKNVYTVDKAAVSMVSEYAVNCMERMVAICKSNGIEYEADLIRVPELVLSEVDLSSPVRIEFKSGVAESLKDVSGLKIMLDSSHGVYLTSENIKYHEKNVDAFCIEIKHSPGKISISFADRGNNLIEKLEMPVSFILPASSRFSSVMRTTKDGIKIIGGEYNALFKTVAFMTDICGTYSVVANDFTLNDTDKLTESEQEAVIFAAATGAVSLDNSNFKPNETLTNEEFITALIKLFYEVNPEATSTFTDVSVDDECYSYIASAEELGLTSLFEGTAFEKEKQISRETAVALCGRTLVKSGKFAYPEKDDENLPFADKKKLSELSLADISVALSSEVLNATKYFSPNAKLSRKEASVLLYNTYMALFEDAAVTTSTSIKKEVVKEISEQKTDWELYAAIIIFAAILVLFICYIIIKIIKRRKKLSSLNKEISSDKENDSEQN